MQTRNWVTYCDPATQWPENLATRRPSWPDDPVLQWTPNVDLCVKKYSQAKEFFIIIVQQQTPDNDFCHFSISNVRFAFWAFFENRKNSGLTPGQNDDPVTRAWKMTQMTHWLGDLMTQYHVWHGGHNFCRKNSKTFQGLSTTSSRPIPAMFYDVRECSGHHTRSSAITEGPRDA